MNSKMKGNIAEAVALSEFTKRNIQVSIPFGDNARYDLIAEFSDKLNRIQVKYCDSFSENESAICICESKRNHTTNKTKNTYIGEVDYFFFYIQKWDKCVLISIDDIGSNKSICFRNEATKNNQHYRNVDDYTIDKVII